MKIWAKIRANGEYHSQNIAHAAFGFMELGAKIVKYEKIADIINWVTPYDIVLDYIDQCNTIFNKFGVTPYVPDYPEQFNEFLGRKIWKDNINSISLNESKWSRGTFVKPVKDKVFTGKVIQSLADLVGCGSCYENYEVYVSEAVNIKAEWRCFILYDNIIDIRPYGTNVITNRNESWKYHYDYKVVESMLEKFREWEDRPVACSMDIAVIDTDIPVKIVREDENGNEIIVGWRTRPNYKTILVEFNDAYALGNYGLQALSYAKLISARWSQLLNRPDEFNFLIK